MVGLQRRNRTHATAIVIATPPNMVAVGLSGALSRSADDGVSWTLSGSELTAEDFNDLEFVDSRTGWVVGDNGVIAHPVDAEHWSLQNSGVDADLDAMDFTDFWNGWAVGEDTETLVILHTTDRGTNWSAEHYGGSFGTTRLFFLDAQYGWIVGSRMIRTRDGGETWQLLSSSYSYDRPSSVWFFDSNNGVLMNSGGSLRRTTDGGAT